MPSTTNLGLTYPAPADPANVPSDMGVLANGVDGPYGAWTAYTPTWTAATTNPVLGNGTIVGRFVTRGKLGQAHILITAGGTTTFGTGAYIFSLPPGWTRQSAANFEYGFGWAAVFDVSATTAFVGVVVAGPATTNVSIKTHGAAASASGTVPVTLATGDQIAVRMVMELA